MSLKEGEHTRDKFKRAKEQWRLPLVRAHLVPNVIDHAGALKQHGLLWRRTVVTFVGEDGIDQGGLTAEMHATFWREVLHSSHGLFHTIAEGGAHLPRPDARREDLVAVGCVAVAHTRSPPCAHCMHTERGCA